MTFGLESILFLVVGISTCEAHEEQCNREGRQVLWCRENSSQYESCANKEAQKAITLSSDYRIFRCRLNVTTLPFLSAAHAQRKFPDRTCPSPACLD